MEKDKVIKTLKSIFTNFLMRHQWDYDDDYSRTSIKNELDLMCQPFVDGGLINSFMNIFDMSNNISEDNEMNYHYTKDVVVSRFFNLSLLTFHRQDAS